MSSNSHADWPLYVLHDLVGYLQKEQYLRTAEMLSDAAFVFVEELSDIEGKDGIPDIRRFATSAGRKLN